MGTSGWQAELQTHSRIQGRVMVVACARWGWPVRAGESGDAFSFEGPEAGSCAQEGGGEGALPERASPWWLARARRREWCAGVQMPEASPYAQGRVGNDAEGRSLLWRLAAIDLSYPRGQCTK